MSRPYNLAIHSIRNISSPEDLENSRTVYAGQTPLAAILDIETDENVRGYLVEAEGKQKRVPSNVHKAILDTLANKPSSFTVLNGGITIVAKSCIIDDKSRSVTLIKPSIINGSQTQGVINDFAKQGNDISDIHIKFELIITEDEDLIGDISIARNFQNNVQLLSIAGRQGDLDEIESAFCKVHPNLRLQKNESERSHSTNDIIPTEKLLQVLAALLPPELWWKSSEYSKTYTYSAKATCLKDFRKIIEEHEKGDPKFSKLYQYYLDMAGVAWTEYSKWKCHQGFQGTGLRAIERDGKEIIDVPDGIIFPIVASLAQLVVHEKGRWHIKQIKDPSGKGIDKQIIDTAKEVYMEIAKSKPEIMGKSKPCYSAINRFTSMCMQFSAS